ncbi:Hypothetical protein CAP_8044 [Chondromyces apiculatus DSM 436]|uniref:Uncharacterized protein n=1 Tax=Chondromyces apiculatus DSM 436 TaxID=1192034 RepID=A0A017SX05_9BACT|nr:Hypothetical protein CAP_8044 [Chondromyces apiculatus DSM 436]
MLVARQDTHLDSLAERLREPRVRAIVAPMIAGSSPGSRRGGGAGVRDRKRTAGSVPALRRGSGGGRWEGGTWW